MATTSARGPRSRAVRTLAVAAGLAMGAAPLLFTPAASATPAQEAPTTPTTVVPKPSALRQIEALRAEKASRTPAERKVDSHLLWAENKRRTGVAVQGVPNLRNTVKTASDGTTAVDITGTVTPALEAAIRAAGGTVVSSVPRFGTVTARVPVTSITALAGRADVRNISPSGRSTTQQAPAPGPQTQNVGAYGNEADLTEAVATARSTYGVDGTGVKVCVISDGVASLTTSQAAGDLPVDVDVLSGQAGSGDEGTAMLELIHDLVPGASLGFATANPSQAQFAQNVLDLQAAGCKVIVDDVIYFAEDSIHEGVIDAAIRTVRAAGVSYFSAAGNEGNLAAGTSDTWQGDFSPSGAPDPAPLAGANLHDFGGTNGNVLLNNGMATVLTWANPRNTAATDYDVYDMNGAGTTIFDASTNVQDGSGGDDQPIELMNGAYAGEQILVDKFAGDPVFLRLQTYRGALTHQTAGTTVGHPANGDAIGVAAAPAKDAFQTGDPTGPYPDPYTGSQSPETFSSDGPVRHFFNADGTAITPGNFTATGGEVTNGPRLTAADGVSTGVTGFQPFFGTSAAAPNAAAIAALALGARPTITTTQLESAMKASALDIGPAGTDVTTGAGIVMAPALLTNLDTEVNAVPVGVADEYDVAPNTALGVVTPGVLANDTDGDGDTLTATKATEPAHGTVTLNSNGSFTYTPTTDYKGDDTFTYKVSDGFATTAPITVTIHVDRAPVAVDDSYAVGKNSSGTDLDVTSNDTDADGDSLTPSVATGPSHGTAVVNGTKITYTPTSGYSGSDSFTYKVSDGTLTSSTATVSITVNSAPVANDDAYSAVSGTAKEVDAPGVLDNDTDGDGDTLTATKATDPSHGTVTFNSDGSFSYTATAGYRGQDSFTYTVSDGDLTSSAATVTLYVSTPNDAYLREVYNDLLERTANSSGAAYWTAFLDAGAQDGLANTTTRTKFVKGVLGSQEYRLAAVQDAYTNVLDRLSDPAGAQYWATQLAKGKTLRTLYGSLIGSAEFYGKHGSNPSSYVDAVYQLLLDRPADAGAKAFWVSKLANGTSRPSMAVSIYASAEARGLQVRNLYQQLLDRNPTSSERSAGITAIKDGSPNPLILALAATQEYLDRAIADQAAIGIA